MFAPMGKKLWPTEVRNPRLFTGSIPTNPRDDSALATVTDLTQSLATPEPVRSLKVKT
jgi:hypothetical protein